MKKLLRDQPILVGCGVFLLSAVLFCGAGLGLVARGCGAASSKLGVASLPATIAAASRAGFGLGIQAGSDEGLVYSMEPHLPREVSCSELFEILAPQLDKEPQRIFIRSVSTTVDEGGRVVTVPVECTWSGVSIPGSPGSDGELPPVAP